MNYTQKSIQRFDNARKNGSLDYSKLLKKLKKVKKKELDEIFHDLHKKEFEKISCLECARCCNDLGPLLLQSDIDRMAKKIKVATSEFYRSYVEMDEDGDYIFNVHPCPFLMNDNYCSVYDSRPKACQEYPHTDRQKMVQILEKTIKNAEFCPAVFNILEKLNQIQL